MAAHQALWEIAASTVSEQLLYTEPADVGDQCGWPGLGEIITELGMELGSPINVDVAAVGPDCVVGRLPAALGGVDARGRA